MKTGWVKSNPNLLQDIVDATPACICIRDLAGRHQLVNSAFAEAVGRPKAELLGKTAAELFSGDFAKPVDANFQSTIQTGEAQTREHGAPGNCDKPPFFLKSSFPLRDTNGTIYATCIFAPDTTQSRIEQHELQQTMNAIHTAAIVATTDCNGIITTANENFCRVSGYSKEELLGKTHRILSSGTHSASFFKELWDTVNLGRTWRGEIKNKRKNGDFYWVQSVISPIKDLNGVIKKFIVVRFDITGQKDAQEKLLETARLTSLEQLAAGVAHEINNPLAILAGKVGKLARLLRAGKMDQKQVGETLGRSTHSPA